MLHQVAKVVTVSAALGVTGGSLVLLQRNEWKISTLGLVRFGRAAHSVCILLFIHLMTWTLSVSNILNADMHISDRASEIHESNDFDVRYLNIIKIDEYL